VAAVSDEPGHDPLIGRLTRGLVLPLVRVLGALKRFLERLVSRRGNVPRSDMIEEELEAVITEGRAAGVMDQSDEELLKSVIEFGDTLVREVMVPRIDMGAFEIDAPLAEVLDAVVRRGHSRWPVYRESVDHVVGILHAKDLLSVWQRGERTAPLAGMMRPVIFVPENQRISALLREFKKRRTHLAIVLDEFGGTAGLVTLEDLVEEIIGEVADEFEPGLGEQARAVEGGWLLDSRASLALLGERLGIPEEQLASRESETVGGLVSELLGRLPRAGDEAVLGAWTLRVADTDGRRILRILAVRQP
jgi:CBS domain containing-hemolysin-like protein